MRLLRRRALPANPELVEVAAAFARCAEYVDLAQRAMIRCVPSSPRATPLPLAVGAETLRESLAAAAVGMAAWRHPAVERAWQQCSSALTETLAGLETAVARAAATRELEVALTAVQDLLDPLHAFVDAEEALAAAGRRR
ncbi:MAG TPA: hypothetical protein VNA14_09120 [Mycobacteriales bacterium]|nr:hypothetical protein [Mycobacteriales bacterium]